MSKAPIAALIALGAVLWLALMALGSWFTVRVGLWVEAVF